MSSREFLRQLEAHFRQVYEFRIKRQKAYMEFYINPEPPPYTNKFIDYKILETVNPTDEEEKK